MTKIERRQHHMRQISEKVAETSGPLPTETPNHHVMKDLDKLSYTNPKDRYHISPAQYDPLEIGKFIHDNVGDPAFKVNI